MRERVYEIHDSYGDPTVVSGLTEDGVGVRYTDADGAQVFVPWHAVDKVVRRVVDEPADEAPVDDDEPTDEVKAEPAKAAAKKASKATTAREWNDGDTDKARAWAKEQNMGVAASGPLPAEVKAAYAAAHSD